MVSKPPNARLFIHLSFLKDSSNNIFYKALQWSLIQIILKQYMYLYIVISKKNSVVDKNIRKEITCTKNFNIFMLTLTLTLTPGVSL